MPTDNLQRQELSKGFEFPLQPTPASIPVPDTEESMGVPYVPMIVAGVGIVIVVGLICLFYKDIRGVFTHSSPSPDRQVAEVPIIVASDEPVAEVSVSDEPEVVDNPHIEPVEIDTQPAKSEVAGSLAEQSEVFFDLHEEYQKNGFDNLRDYIEYGSTELHLKLMQAEQIYQRAADEFDRADALAEISAVRAAIRAKVATKIYYGEYPFSASNTRVSGDYSSFQMTIPAGFTSYKIDKVVSPMPDITGTLRVSDKAWHDSVAAYYQLKGTSLNIISRPSLDRLSTFPEPILYASYKHEENTINLTISGKTDSIRELVRNSDNYIVRVWFTNLRFAGVLWRVNRRGHPLDGIASTPPPNPLLLDRSGQKKGPMGSETSVSADVLKIEIVKVE